MSSLAISFAKVGQFDRAKKVVSTMNEGNRAMALAHIAASLAEAGKIADAVQTVSSIDNSGRFPDSWFSESLMVLTREQKYEPALQMANTIRDESQKAWTLAWLANELVKVGKTELASRAIKPALEIIGFEPIVRQ